MRRDKAMIDNAPTSTAAIHTTHCNERRLVVVQVPSAHAVGGRYAHQKPTASSAPAPIRAYGRRNARRAKATAPVTPSKATAQGTVQQRPSAAARPPMPRAPPAAPMTRAFSPIGPPLRPQGASICYSNADTIRSVPWYGVKSCLSPTPLRDLPLPPVFTLRQFAITSVDA